VVAAAIRTIFAKPDAEHVREQLDTIAAMRQTILIRTGTTEYTAKKCRGLTWALTRTQCRIDLWL
jgi:hypothetical protein